MHIHEFIFYINTKDSIEQNVCVANFPEYFSKYNYINILIHHLIPFCIQIMSITLLIIFTARSRSRMTENNNAFIKALKQQFNNQKELYVTPLIIVLSGLPQIIISSIFSCTNLLAWQTHLLCITYFLSYTPQILGFVLFVLPSTNYLNEFQQTRISKLCLFKYVIKQEKKITSGFSHVTMRNTAL
jgi:hypothetical protein